MNLLHNPVPWILPALCCGWMTAAGQESDNRMPDDGGVRKWTFLDGRSIDAYFNRISGNNIVMVNKQGAVAELSIARLSQPSKLQAKALSEIIDVFRPVPGNRFKMGSPDDEPGREDIETVHWVHLTSFDMKATEVTWTEWNAVRNSAAINGYNDISPGGNGTAGLDADLNPVVGITWWDALKWCNLKSQLEKRKPAYNTANGEVFKNKTGRIKVDWSSNGYRLPTEAEWEYACREGRASKWAFHTGQIKETGDGKDRNMDQAGWYVVNSNGGPHPVAGKDANSLKLYDMHGNAAEWCWDVSVTLGTRDVTNPRGPDDGERRIVRGGSWNDPARVCRAAARGSLIPGATPDRTVGFRLVRPLQ